MQRTRAETVGKYFGHFMEAYPHWERIAEADLAQLSNILRPFGLWNRRAISLSALARDLVSRDQVWPNSRDELELIPAVGQYLASAVLLFRHEMPEPLLDSGMARVLRRYFGLEIQAVDIRYDALLQLAARDVLRLGNPKEINWAILDLAALICKPTKPLCRGCPLRARCDFKKNLGSGNVMTRVN